MARYLHRKRAPVELPLAASRALDAAASEWGVDWWTLRIACSEQFRTAPREVREWGVPDLLEAHASLDALEIAQPAIQRQRERDAKRGGR